jgi:hypothetical protein
VSAAAAPKKNKASATANKKRFTLFIVPSQSEFTNPAAKSYTPILQHWMRETRPMVAPGQSGRGSTILKDNEKGPNQ